MKTNLLLLAVLSVLAMAPMASAETVGGLPLHIDELDEGVVRVWIGDHVASTAMVGIAAADGIVVIDNTGAPDVDRELRKIIARELGRDDFKYLINTHHHRDHTGGNEVFDDCVIVGHDLVPLGMDQMEARNGQTLQWFESRYDQLEEEVAALDDDDPEADATREWLVFHGLNFKAARELESFVRPDVTFTDRMEFSMGDRTFELHYIGGMHTHGDIAVVVPELGLVFTGDTMADNWLTENPGCLGAFRARIRVVHDFPHLLTNWNALLARRGEIKAFVPGHWNGELSFEGFEARVKYVEELWNGVNETAANGGTLDTVLEEYTFTSRFAALVDSPGCSTDNNTTTIGEMWSCATGQKCAAVELYIQYMRDHDEAAIEHILAQVDAESPTHYFLQANLNQWGYRLLRDEKAEEAAVLLKLNVDLYPESANVYDSYGEALYALGDGETALAMYEKSLELNPANANADEMIGRIRRGEALD
jgi:glyoxylase-like metal-dependent hydrolase (beta-lactamase superfamily II)